MTPRSRRIRGVDAAPWGKAIVPELLSREANVVTDVSARTRWVQLSLGLVCMVVISSPQYVWALFTQPLTTGLGSTLPELQITFSILIVVQTFLSPWQGVLVDRFGPRLLLSLGALITGLSWILAARVSSLTMLY